MEGRAEGTCSPLLDCFCHKPGYPGHYVDWELRILIKFYTPSIKKGSVIDAASLVYKKCEELSYGTYNNDTKDIKDFIRALGIDFTERYANLSSSRLEFMVHVSLQYGFHPFVAFKRRLEYKVPAGKPSDVVMEVNCTTWRMRR
ncbi:hypothetical protein MRX96_016749 [Rhipicephalus microplus]